MCGSFESEFCCSCNGYVTHRISPPAASYDATKCLCCMATKNLKLTQSNSDSLGNLHPIHLHWMIRYKTTDFRQTLVTNWIQLTTTKLKLRLEGACRQETPRTFVTQMTTLLALVCNCACPCFYSTESNKFH